MIRVYAKNGKLSELFATLQAACQFIERHPMWDLRMERL